MISIAEQGIRSFIAIQLPQELRSALHELVQPLQGLPLNVKWVPESNYHLTLKFLGDIAPGDIGSLGAQLHALADRKCFTLSLGGWGMFPNPKRPNVFWAGLGGELETLQQLWTNLEDCLSARGYPRERRWHPHITLGRFRSPDRLDSLNAWLGQTPSFGHIGSFTATGLTLMESRLSPGGPNYHPQSFHEFQASVIQLGLGFSGGLLSSTEA
jgi:2'-5' RNA ligase